MILVTGATGNVGRPVVDGLLARDQQVRAAVRSPEEVVPDGVDTVSFDFRDPDTWAAALDGVQGLFLLRPPSVGDVENNLLPFVDRALEQGVEHIVFLSVEGAEKLPIPHRTVERHLTEVEAPATLLRPGFFAQNLATAYKRDIVEHDRIVVPVWRAGVAWTDTRDIGEVGAIALAERRLVGEAPILTGPVTHTFDEVVELLSEYLGRSIRHKTVDPLTYAAHIRGEGAPWMLVGIQTALHLGLAFGASDHTDPTMAEILGRRPRDIADYIADHVDVWRKDA
jgi:uncharacterized protein YbjT (DUF2867 family)